MIGSGKKAILFLVLGFVLILAGCSDTADSPEAKTPDTKILGESDGFLPTSTSRPVSTMESGGPESPPPLRPIEKRAIEIARAAGYAEVGIAEHGIATSATLADEVGPAMIYLSVDSFGGPPLGDFTVVGIRTVVKGVEVTTLERSGTHKDLFSCAGLRFEAERPLTGDPAAGLTGPLLEADLVDLMEAAGCFE